MATKYNDYLCWNENTDKDNGVVISEMSAEAAAKEYVNDHLVPYESVSELDNVTVLVAGPEPKTLLFEISVKLEPVVYVSAKAG